MCAAALSPGNAYDSIPVRFSCDTSSTTPTKPSLPWIVSTFRLVELIPGAKKWPWKNLEPTDVIPLFVRMFGDICEPCNILVINLAPMK